jgi:hypothetical protein
MERSSDGNLGSASWYYGAIAREGREVGVELEHRVIAGIVGADFEGFRRGHETDRFSSLRSSAKTIW